MKKLYIIVIALFLLASYVAPAMADSMPPSVPTGIGATINQSGQIYVSWNASTDDTSVVGYYLYRNGQIIASVPGFTFYNDLPTPGTYTYTVTAYDAAGNVSAQSLPSTPVTTIQDNSAPTAPTWIGITAATSSLTLSWNPSTDNVGVIGYYIYRNGVKISLDTTLSATTYIDTGFTPGTSATYVIVAYDAATNSASSVPRSATTLSDSSAPTTPIPTSIVAKSPKQINLSWQPSTDNQGVVGYNIYRGGSLVGNVSGTVTSYSDIGLSGGTTYSYTVAAYDAAGNLSAQSPSVQAATLDADYTPPTVPTNFSAKARSASEIDLSWNPSLDNYVVAGYYVYRNGAQVANVTSTFYADTNLTTSTSYDYGVKAYDDSSNQSAQSTLTAVTLSTNPTTGIGSGTSGSGGYSTGGTGVVSLPPSATPFTVTLRYGSRGTDVTNLQIILIQMGFLGPTYGTGFYGGLTQKAVQQFQCNQGVICSGSPLTTGWGQVGAKTRKSLNSLISF